MGIQLRWVEQEELEASSQTSGSQISKTRPGHDDTGHRSEAGKMGMGSGLFCGATAGQTHLVGAVGTADCLPVMERIEKGQGLPSNSEPL